MNRLSKVLGLTVAAGILGAAWQIQAVSYSFSTIHSSSGTPAGPAPYATLMVTQDGANQVKLKLSATSLGSGEFISYLKYNIDGSATSPAITAAITGSLGLPTPPSFAFLSSPATDASLQFDAEVNFPTSGSGGGVNRFTNGEYLEWTLSRSGLTVDSIDLPMMIHIQGIANGGSAKVIATLDREPPIKTPDNGTTATLLGGVLLALAGLRKRLSK